MLKHLKSICMISCLTLALTLFSGCGLFSSDSSESQQPESVAVPEPTSLPAVESMPAVESQAEILPVSMVGTWVWNEGEDTFLIFQEDATLCRYSGNEILKGTYRYDGTLHIVLTGADGNELAIDGTINEAGHLQLANTSGLFVKKSDSTLPPSESESSESQEETGGGTLQTKGLWVNDTIGMAIRFPSPSEAVFENTATGTSETISYEFDGLTYIFYFPEDRIETGIYDDEDNLMILGMDGVFVCE